ncbi:hypothetical protein BH24BAC1_BH24BAC1_03070 [soil metagenome]
MTSKKAMILGGSSGIGKATALRFAREGWHVAVASVDLQQEKGCSPNSCANN